MTATTPAVFTRPLDGPFLSAAQLTDYRDEPGYAILLPERVGYDEGTD